MEDVFSFKAPSKPVIRTLQINLLYYRQNYMLMWIILYCIFLYYSMKPLMIRLFRLCLVQATFALGILALYVIY